jgi:heme oxygenase
MNDDTLDLRHLIRLADEDDLKSKEEWKDYSESTSTFKEPVEEQYLDGKTKRRLRRLQERKLKKK